MPATADYQSYVRHLKKQLKDLTTRVALVKLSHQYRLTNKTFLFDGVVYTIKSALADIPEYLLDMPCEHFGTLRFFGGPPGSGRWFNGTVLTLLCDSVLFDESTKHLSTSEMLAS